MDVTSRGQSVTLETIKKFLAIRFSHMQQPGNDIVYDTLVQLQQERKIYQTAKGYFIVTPEYVYFVKKSCVVVVAVSHALLFYLIFFVYNVDVAEVGRERHAIKDHLMKSYWRTL